MNKETIEALEDLIINKTELVMSAITGASASSNDKLVAETVKAMTSALHDLAFLFPEPVEPIKGWGYSVTTKGLSENDSDWQGGFVADQWYREHFGEKEDD